MGLIREPLNVDFVVDARPLTPQEELAISEFIKADKEKRKLELLKLEVESIASNKKLRIKKVKN